MAADERLSSIATQQPVEELKAINDGLKLAIDNITAFNQAARGLEINLKGAANIKEAVTVTAQLSDVNGQLAKSYQATAQFVAQYNGHSKEIVQVDNLMIKGKQELVRLALLQERASATSTKALQAEAKAAADAENAYKLLQKQHKEAVAEASRLAAAHGLEAKATIEATKTANEYGNKLKAIHQSMGNYRDSVGHYQNATNGLRMSMQQIARELPSLSNGFHTFFSAIGNNIAPAQDALRAFNKEQAILKEQGKPTQSVWSALGSSIFNVQTGLLLAVTALTMFGSKIVDSISGLFSEKKALEDAAKAQEEWNKKKQKANDLLDENIKRHREQDGATSDRIKVLERELALANAQGAAGSKILSIQQEITKEKIKQLKSDLGAVEMEMTGAMTRGDKPLTDAIVKRMNAIKAEIADLYNQLNVDQAEFNKKQAELSKDAAEKEKREAEKRKKQREKEAKERKEALEEETKTTLEHIRGRFRKQLETNKIVAEDEKKSLKERLMAYEKMKFDTINIAKISGVIEGKVQEDIDADLIRILGEFEKKKTKIVEDEAAKRDAAEGKTQKGIFGVIGRDLKSGKQEDKEKDRNLQEYGQKGMQFAEEIGKLNEALSKKKLDAIDREIEAINKRRDAELAAIDATNLSEDEKARKKADINARAAAQEAQLADTKRQQQRKNAEIEKAITISQIIASTALAVVRALGSIPYTPANIALAAATGAIGAAQLAVAIATPIPQFAEGTDDSPEGLAIVGERGKEMVIEPSGKAYITPDKASLTYLPKHSQVITNEELLNLSRMYSFNLPMMAAHQQGMNTAKMESKLDDLKNAITNKPVAALNITGMGMQRLAQQANGITQYIQSFST